MSLPNVVLVHGAWADGSSWAAVIERLQADGYHVTGPQFPMTTLADNVARLRQVLAVQDGPAPPADRIIRSAGGVAALRPWSPWAAGGQGVSGAARRRRHRRG
jgi:pimeloyl-ACP methyl ester carboxylesterase